VKHLRISIAVLAAIGSLATVGSVLAATTSATAVAKVTIARTGLGRVLVDGRGHTLYLFKKDTRAKSACAGQCVAYWPPLITSGKPLAAAGARASLLGTIRRADGLLQVTYNRHPLYTFFQDTKKGQTNGEGLDDFGAHWYAVSPAGTPIANSSTSNQASSGNQSSNSSPGNYGY
jgi:predicted lipoprotein with Yx(FWY)xxD motif